MIHRVKCDDAIFWRIGGRWGSSFRAALKYFIVGCPDSMNTHSLSGNDRREAERLTAGSVAVPITAGDSGGIQFLCSVCDFPKNDTLTMDMSFCWNCGIKLDWSEWEHVK